MTRFTRVAAIALVGAAVAVVGTSLSTAQTKDAKPAGAAQDPSKLQLPPGMTLEDMQAMMAAATPGKEHERLVKGAGKWEGKTTMWMTPGAEPMTSTCTATVTPMFDGRYVRIDVLGEMPGMGPYVGFGINGFDNVSKQYTAVWLDNMSTGMMTGTGDLSSDGKVMTYNYTFNCPILKKPVAARQVETTRSDNSMTLEMYGPDPKTGKEYKMMQVEYTRK